MSDDQTFDLLPEWPQSPRKHWKWQPADAATPDPQKWISPSGYQCMVARNTGGAWCGYVAIPSAHPLFVSRHLVKVPTFLAAHGGVTYHTTRDDYRVLVVGFDCRHSGDQAPGEIPSTLDDAVYRDVVYAIIHTEALAAQVKDYASWSINKVLNAGRAAREAVKEKHFPSA